MGGAGVLRIRILHFFIRSRLCFSVKIRTNPYQLEALKAGQEFKKKKKKTRGLTFVSGSDQWGALGQCYI